MAAAAERRPVYGEDLGTRMCELLGLDPMTVAEIRLECRPGEVTHVYVRRLVFGDEAEELQGVLDAYELAEKTT